MPTAPTNPPPVTAFPETLPGLGPYGTWPYVERRTQPDRRLGKTRLFSRFVLKGDRLGGRRHGELHNIYVDRYLPQDVALAVAILVLNILDAVLTLSYIQVKGGGEANPLARQLMQMGTGWFMFSKGVVVAMCVLFLLVHKMFKYVRPAMIFLFAFYFALLVYHVYLQIVTPVTAAT